MKNLPKVDWNKVREEGFGNFQPLAEGTYAAKITKSEVVKTKKADDMLKLTFTLLGGKGIKNRKIFENCMLTHSNPQVVNIGLSKLSRLAEILGISDEEFEDSSQLHDQPIGLNLIVESNEKYGDQNKIKSFVEFDESLLEVSEDSNDIF